VTETQEAELPTVESPVDESPVDLATAEPLVAAWRSELQNQGSIGATQVQDHLLDLWGLLPEGDARAQVEVWLTETLERNLYVAADVDARLARFLPTQNCLPTQN